MLAPSSLWFMLSGTFQSSYLIIRDDIFWVRSVTKASSVRANVPSVGCKQQPRTVQLQDLPNNVKNRQWEKKRWFVHLHLILFTWFIHFYILTLDLFTAKREPFCVSHLFSHVIRFCTTHSFSPVIFFPKWNPYDFFFETRNPYLSRLLRQFGWKLH